jgi:hypothetical protein
MNEKGTLLKCEEATRFIERIGDPITKALVNMAFVHFVKKVHLEKRAFPDSDLDMLFVMTSLKEFFDDHTAVAQTLDGAKVGAWFEDER